MKKYFSFYRIRFIGALQYRAAALGGIATQFAWGAMLLLLYQAFYRSDPTSIPMPYHQLSSYIWLHQALLVLFITTRYDLEIVESITKGGIAYDLARPVSLYGMWIVKDMASRVAGVMLRCVPVLMLSAFLPAPYGLQLPSSWGVFLIFLLSLALGTINAAAFLMLQYVAVFYTLSIGGIRSISFALAEILEGSIIPLPFFPDGVRQVIELLPFASILNTPLRIYIGELQAAAALQALLLQVFWAIVMILTGFFLLQRASRRVVVQGG